MGELNEIAVALLATVTGIDATSTGSTVLYTVPPGKSLVVTRVVVRCTSFTAGSKAQEAVASFGANSATYDDYLNTVTYTVDAANKAIHASVLDSAVPVYGAGDEFRVIIETGSDADVETWAVDVFGYLV